MNKKILLKTGTFSFIVIMNLLITSNAVMATVVYTNVTDQTFTQANPGTQSYSVDLNNDLAVDFHLNVSDGVQSVPQGSFDGESVSIISVSGNFVLDDGSLGRFARALVLNDNIQSASTTWETYGGVLSANGDVTFATITTPVVGGNFTNTTDKYIGVRFLIGANTHYGWIRVDVTGYNSFTIKDFAYEDVANQSITAGQMPTGISDYLRRSTVIKNTENGLMIEFEKVFNGTIELVNVSGLVIVSKSVKGMSSLLETNHATQGIYTVVIRSENEYAAKKVMVQ